MTIDISAVPVELWDVTNIHPYPYNNKKHPEKQIETLAKLIKAHGLIDPIALDENGVIISGHGRFEAVKRLGFTKVAVRVLRGLTDDQTSALRIAANKSVSTEYDTDMLARELTKLAATDYDLSMLGLDQRELDMLISDVGVIDTDALVDDIDFAVEQHEADVNDRAAAADDESVRLDKAFGFKSVPLPAQKTVTRFLATIEAETGKTGVDALLDHMKAVLESA